MIYRLPSTAERLFPVYHIPSTVYTSKRTMAQQITIDPITRIEGHGKITIQLDEQGKVVDARFHVTQFRGFEKLCEGRPFYEMPSLMARICGICPVSHLDRLGQSLRRDSGRRAFPPPPSSCAPS